VAARFRGAVFRSTMSTTTTTTRMSLPEWQIK